MFTRCIVSLFCSLHCIQDTAGQERFKSITSGYYRGAHGIIIVYDITNADSFDSVRDWMNEIDRYGSEHVHRLLIGNKKDLVYQRAIEYDAAKEFADAVGMTFIETSAKSNTNVEEAFITMAREIKAAQQSKTVSGSGGGGDRPRMNLQPGVNLESSGGCC
jgi:GTPase SAR1 family protein